MLYPKRSLVEMKLLRGIWREDLDSIPVILFTIY